ncbi:MAG: CoA-binding protein [Candidatus Atabeyarchaeum deiterrae]
MTESKPLDQLFNPRSLAIVGDRRESNFYWARSIQNADFKGLVYYVNTAVNQALGNKFYKSLLEIPESVDYVIVSVPAKIVPRIIADCAEKNVKFASIFSSGFSETGSEEGRKLEDQILKAAKGKVRVIGPNCMGVYCPRSGLAFRLDQSKRLGSVSFISQSGGLSISFTLAGPRHGISFSKVVSYGNAVDIGDAELVNYLANDPDTKIIAAYLEGTKNGQRLIDALRNASAKKPVIVWKGGRTTSGSKAVASHTGSLAGSTEIWETVMRQTRVVEVESLDELIGTTKLFLFAPPSRGRGIALVSISGGSSVVNTDAVIQSGLQVSGLAEETKKALRSAVQGVGTSVSNPIDIAGSFYNPDILREVMTRIGEDSNIDAVIVEVAPLYLVSHSKNIRNYKLPSIIWSTLMQGLNHIRLILRKPVLVALVDIGYEKETRKLERTLTKSEIPCFQNVGSAAKALSIFTKYHDASLDL